VEPVVLDAVLLRSRAPDLMLRPGMLLAARVAERAGKHGVITLAGTPLVAELPDEVKAGDRLRLTVQEIGGERVVLKMTELPPPAPGAALPLPDGREARIRAGDREGEGRGAAAGDEVAVDYDSPALGTLGFRLSMAGDTLLARVRIAPAAAALATAEADALRERLELATGREAQVRVEVRREPVDVYA
jgi:hypothetical protein